MGMTAAGDLLSNAALTAIHWSHRVGALVTAVALFLLGWRLCRQRAHFLIGATLLAALMLQLGLGIANVMLSLPLALAAAHNAGAALLVGVMVWANYRLSVAPSSVPNAALDTAAKSGSAGILCGRSAATLPMGIEELRS